MPAKRDFPKTKSDNVFGQARKPAKMFRVGLYARVSTNDQQTLPMQSRALREYVARRGWTIAVQVREVGSGAPRENLVRNCWRLLAVGRSTPAGRAMASLLAVFAEFEEVLRERTRAGLAQADRTASGSDGPQPLLCTVYAAESGRCTASA